MHINDSFIAVSDKLKEKHIINNDFFLKTLNADVDNLDPFSETLNVDEKKSIITECKENIWYFFRNIVRFQNIDGEPIEYRLDLSKLASIYCCINNINNHVVTPRQTYTLHSSAAMQVWEILFGENYNKIIINDIYNFGNTFFLFVCDIIDLLPKFLRDTVKYDKNNFTVINIETGDIKLQGSKYPVSKRNITHIRDENVSNISIYPDFELMAVTTDLLTSLPNENKSYSILPTAIIPKGMMEYDKIEMFITSSLLWDAWFYDLSAEALKCKLRRESLTNYMYIEYSYTDLGYDDEWFNSKCALMLNNKEVIDRELLLRRK